MSTEHNIITDPNIHETKGASTASVGQLLVATGSGTATFQSPTSQHLVTSTLSLSQGSSAIQNPSAVNTPMKVALGSAVTGADVSIAVDGTITFNTAAYYRVVVDLNIYRTTTTGNAVLLIDTIKNGTEVSPVKSYTLSSVDTLKSYCYEYEGYFSATNTFYLNLIRDGSGVNDGGLEPLTPGLGTVAAVSSAYVRVYKYTGM